MTEFGIELTGDRRAVLRFDKFPAAAHDRLLETLKRIEQRMEAAVLSAEPQRTGALRGLTGGRVYDHGTRIAAVVGVRTQDASEARKASALEYGSRGTSITVRAHAQKLDHVWRRARNGPPVDVRAYSRVPRIAAHNFLRGPIDAIRGEAIAEMQAAIEQAVADSETA